MLAQTSTHTTLLARLAGGTDQPAWREFCDRYGRLIREFARRRGLQPADCDDVLQEVLIGLTRSMPGFEYDPAKGRFRSYLMTICLRAIYRISCQKRKEAVQQDIDEAVCAAASDTGVEQAWETEWRQYHVRQAMRLIEAEFNEPDRAAFDAYGARGRSARETAGQLGLTVDQVYQAKSRIVRRLSELVAQQVREEG